ncbi:MAG TPA: radical SAM protein [Terriglobales bacterium]
MAKIPPADARLWEEDPGKLRLVGIARLAEMGEAVDSGHNVEFSTIPSRSILNRCSSARMAPFVWTINPYRGCEFACRYCYARYAHEYMEKDPLEFERKIYVKEHAAWLLSQELKKVKPGEGIAVGTATDPYQPIERRRGLTRSILEVLARASGLQIGLVTKSNLIVRDIDLLKQIAERSSIRLHLTVTTTDTELARKLEPRAPRPDLRLEAVRRLRAAGLDAGVLCAPVLPGITDSVASLRSVVKAAKTANAGFIGANPVYLYSGSLAVFMPFVREHFPKLVTYYEQNFTATKSFVSEHYRKTFRDCFVQLCREAGMNRREDTDIDRRPQPQARLFA